MFHTAMRCTGSWRWSLVFDCLGPPAELLLWQSGWCVCCQAVCAFVAPLGSWVVAFPGHFWSVHRMLTDPSPCFRYQHGLRQVFMQCMRGERVTVYSLLQYFFLPYIKFSYSDALCSGSQGLSALGVCNTPPSKMMLKYLLRLSCTQSHHCFP